VRHVDAPVGSHARAFVKECSTGVPRPLRALTTFLQPSHVRACAHTWLCCRPAERFTTTIRHQRAEHSHPHPWILVVSFVAILLPSGRERALARETNRECVEERCASAAAIPKIAATGLPERFEVLLTPDRALLDFALFCLIIRFRTRVSTGD